MAEFNGKKGHWVTTDTGSHVFIESGKSFDEAVSDAFGKENVGKYKKKKITVEEVIDKMTENGTKEVNLNAGTIARASNGELTEEEVHKWFEDNDELEDYEAFDDDNDFENWDEEEKEIDYENITYPKGTSKEYTNVVNKKYQNALPILKEAGIKLEDFGGKPSAEGGFEDNTKEIMDKYVFEPFRKKCPSGNNDAWEKEYQPLYDAIEAVADKNYNDWWIKNKR